MSRSSLSIPIGSIRNDQEDYPIRFSGDLTDLHVVVVAGLTRMDHAGIELLKGFVRDGGSLLILAMLVIVQVAAAAWWLRRVALGWEKPA